MFEDIFEQGNAQMRGITKAWVESNKRLLQQYRQLLERQMAEDPWNETMQDLMKMTMSSVMQAAAFQRQAQRSFLETQVAMTERHSAMLDELERRMGSSDNSESKAASEDEGPEPSGR